jgi:mannosyltransferase
VGPDTAVAAAGEGTHEDGPAERPAPTGRSGRAWWSRADPALVGITLVGLVMRAWGLGSQSLWYDEWLTQEAMGGGPRDVVRHVANREGIPLPYFAGLWAWTRPFGAGEVALRSISLVAGVAAIPVAYALARRVAGRWAARAAALLVAVNPLAVWYSQEARPYSILALAGGVVVLAAVRAAGAPDGDAQPHRRDLVLLAAAAAAAVAVHYFAAFLVAAVGIALLLTRRPAWRSWLLAGVPALVVLALLAPLAVKQHSHEANREWITRFPLIDRLDDAGRSALVGPSPPASTLWLVAAAAVVAGVGVGLALAPPAERRAAGLLLAVSGGAVALAVVAAGVGVDAVLGRYLIASLVPLVVGVAVAARWRRGPAGWVGPAAIAVVAGVSLVAVVADARDEDLQRPDWRSVALAFDAEDGDTPGPRALVVNIHGNLAAPLRAYLPDARVLGPDETVEAEAVDAVVAMPTDAPCNFLVGRACSLVFLGAPPPEPLSGELGEPDRRVLGQFALDRYRPPAPVEFGVDDVTANPGDIALVLVDED